MQPSVEDEQEQAAPRQQGDDATIPNTTPPNAMPPISLVTDSPVMPPTVEPHQQMAEIIRQVEYYFSDENLPHDAHLLAKTGPTGQEWVSINEILSWKKMRSFKPPARVKAALCKSQALEVWRNKFIRRKAPLEVPSKLILTTIPTISLQAMLIS